MRHGRVFPLLILLFHLTERGTTEVTKCQTKPFPVAFPAPKYVLADFFAFSGDSRNADCRQFLLFCFLPGAPTDGTCRFVYPHRLPPALLIASEMLTASSFQRVKLGILLFHFPKIWLPRTKQSCLAGETILFDASNYIVWLAKQYCSGHVLSIFRKWNV